MRRWQTRYSTLLAFACANYPSGWKNCLTPARRRSEVRYGRINTSDLGTQACPAWRKNAHRRAREILDQSQKARTDRDAGAVRAGRIQLCRLVRSEMTA